jgi:hypothetical protein
MDEAIVIPIAGMVMVIIIVLGVPLIRVLTRRMEAQAPTALPQDVSARLERIEQAVDSMTLEIERMAEGQRFTTRLLSERLGAEAAVPRGDILRTGDAAGGR